MSQADLKARSMRRLSGAPASSATGNEAIWVCPFCEMPQPEEFEECPQCGIIVSKYLFKLEANRNEVAEIIEKQPARGNGCHSQTKLRSVKQQSLFPPRSGNSLKPSEEIRTSI